MDRIEDWTVPAWFYDEWDQFNIWRPGENDVTEDALRNFIKCIDQAQDERPIQAFLESYPHFLLGTQRTGHGTWIIPRKRLGSEFVTDFLVASGSSGGVFWELLELESPNAVPFQKSGEPSKVLRHAVAQIEEWRRWIERNIGYAQRPKSQDGLGLAQIHSRTAGTIYIGRRAQFPVKYNDIREQFRKQTSISIMTYDRLIELIAAEMLRFRSAESPTDCVHRLRNS